MNALFRPLSQEEFEKLNLDQKMVYLHALAAELHDKLGTEVDRTDEINPSLALFGR